MGRTVAVFVIATLLGTPCLAQKQPQSTPAQQIAAAVLPLPPNMRDQAGVLGYGADGSLLTLRPSANGMICMASPPASDQFDARCYHESFMPVVKRMRELYSQGKNWDDVARTIDAEVKSGKLILPGHPTAGYRMLGPLSAYNPATNTAGKEIETWQSIHFPYKTAAEIGLPEEGQVSRTMPYVMTSGTFWSHVMIEHEPEK